jgi:hypothetical protein
VAAFYNGKKVEDMAGLGGADSIGKSALDREMDRDGHI